MTIIKGPSYTRRTTTRLFGNTFNHVKITLTSQTLEEKLRKVKGSTTARMTRPLIRLKSNLRWFNLPFYFTQDHQSLASTSTRSCFLCRQRFHSHHNDIFILPQVTEHSIDKGKYKRHTYGAKLINKGK